MFTGYMAAWNKNSIFQASLAANDSHVFSSSDQWDMSKRKMCNFQMVSLQGGKQRFLTLLSLLCASWKPVSR